MQLQKKIALLPYFLIFLEIAMFLSNDMYLPSMPAIAKDLNLSQTQIQSTLTLWFLGSSSLQFILGPVSDHYGRRVVVLLGGLVYVLATAACAVAVTLPILLLARFVQGSSLCAVMVAGAAAIHEMFDTKRAIKIFAIMNAVTVLAPAFGPLIGALIVQFVDWRYIFWLLFVMGACSTTLLTFFMPESLKKPHHLNLRGMLNGYKEILCTKNFMLAALGNCFLIGIFFLWMFVAPFIMIDHYKLSNLYYGVSQTLIFGCFFIGAQLTAFILNISTLKRLIDIALIILLFGTIGFAVAAKFYDNMHGSIICMMIISTGASMLFAPLTRISVESSTQPMGRRTAVTSTLISLFGALSGWLLTLVHVEKLSDIAMLIVLFTAIAGLLLLFTKVPVIAKD